MENLNLNTLESNFLSSDNVRAFFKLNQVEQVTSSEANAQKKKFAYTCKLGLLACEIYEQLISDEARELFDSHDISWSREEFYLKAFGWGKSYFHKMKKLGMNQISFPDSVENFTNAVAAFVALGYKASLSREAYNFFMANDGKLKEAVAMEAENAELDNDGADGEDGTDGEDGENSNTDVSITIKLSDKTICLRRTDGQLVSHNSKEDITTALASLIEDVESSLIYSAADAS